MKLKHTPGPWVLVKNPKTKWYDLRIVEAEWSFGGIYGENAEANARLIAAAPEMLEALIKTISVMCQCCNTTTSCEVFQSYNNRKCDQYEACKAAIEKATGLPIEEVIL